jgi:signal transduction histidine kinase/ActR/RegA family two-component response regulator
MKYLLPLNAVIMVLLYSPLYLDYKGNWWVEVQSQLFLSTEVTISYACVVAAAVPMAIDWVLDCYNYYFRGVKELSSVHLTTRMLALGVLVWPACHMLRFPNGIEIKYLVVDYMAQKYFIMVLLLSLLNEIETRKGFRRLNIAAVVLMSASVMISSAALSSNEDSYGYIFLVQAVVFCSYFIMHGIMLFLAIRDYYFLNKGKGGTVLFTAMFVGQALLLLIFRKSNFERTGALKFQSVLAASNYILVGLCVIPTIMPGRVGRENFRDSKRINEFRQSFMRYISHEIRTPLNVSTVGVALMEDTLVTSGRMDDEVSQVMEQTKKALSIATEILNDLLTFEKLSSNLMQLEQTVQRPAEYVASVVNLFEFQAREKQITLRLPEEDQRLNSCFVFIDTYKMSQVVRNLVSNALKFTPRGGFITIAIQVIVLDAHQDNTPFRSGAIVPSSEWVRISVTDTGAGIAPENIGKLFKQIIQFDSNRLQQGGGSGLGMYISRGIVELHGGRIFVTSPGLDRGSTFSLDLPLVRVNEPPAVVPSTLESSASPSLSIDIRDREHGANQEAKLSFEPFGTHGPFAGHLDNIPEGNCETMSAYTPSNPDHMSVMSVSTRQSGAGAGAGVSASAAVASTSTRYGGQPSMLPNIAEQIRPSPLTLPSSAGAGTVIPITVLDISAGNGNTSPHSNKATPKATPRLIASTAANQSGRTLTFKSSLKQMFTNILKVPNDDMDSRSEKSYYTSGNNNSNYHLASSNPSVSVSVVARGRNNSLNSGVSGQGGGGPGYGFSITGHGNSVNTPRSGAGAVGSMNNGPLPSSLSADIEAGKISIPAPSSVPQTQLSTLDLRDTHILVVDDSTMNLKIMTLMLKKFGAEVMTALNGDQALKLVKASIEDPTNALRIDMVIMDNHMDVMNGPVACRLMRSAGFAGPIFGLTGEVNADSDFEYIEAGADHIFRKPLNIKEVVDKFTTIFVR